MTQAVSLKQIEKFLHFSFRTEENFCNSKPRHPGQRPFGRNPDPPGSENLQIPGVARGMVRLGIHKLFDENATYFGGRFF